MPKKKCPGMDPAYFKFSDIRSQACTSCGKPLEFWKDDVFLTCPSCTTRNVNPGLAGTCVAWCKEAVACIGNEDVKEWKATSPGEAPPSPAGEA